MDPRHYQSTRAGIPVRTPQGYWAFIPAPLPPKINWSTSLISALAEAERALASLAGVACAFPIPQVIYQPFIHSEAVISSRIEGTRSNLLDLYSYEIAQLSLFEDTDDVREVHNYVKAMEYGLARRETLPISLRLIREIHKQLMTNVRGEHLTPGEFRHSQNWIGPSGCTLENAPYVPPPVDAMLEALNNLENYFYSEDDIPLIINASLIYYQFEAIHPFLDGNGRIGRLLVILLLCEWKLLPMPVLNLSAYFDRYRLEYYNKLLEVSTRGNWEAWFAFFLDGVKQQAKSDENRILHLSEIRNKYQILSSNARNRTRMLKIIDYLFIHPVFTITQMATDLSIPFKSIGKYVEKLTSNGIAHEITGQARNRVYHAKAILDIFLENYS